MIPYTTFLYSKTKDVITCHLITSSHHLIDINKKILFFIIKDKRGYHISLITSYFDPELLF